MRVVLDSNVLISALISHRSAPRAIYEAWRKRRYDIISSETQLDEIRRVSLYSRMRTVVKPSDFGNMINRLRSGTILERLVIDADLADPLDAFLLAMVVAGDADWLITGDKRAGLLSLGSYGRCRIVTPAGFVSSVRI